MSNEENIVNLITSESISSVLLGLQLMDQKSDDGRTLLLNPEKVFNLFIKKIIESDPIKSCLRDHNAVDWGVYVGMWFLSHHLYGEYNQNRCIEIYPSYSVAGKNPYIQYGGFDYLNGSFKYTDKRLYKVDQHEEKHYYLGDSVHLKFREVFDVFFTLVNQITNAK